MHACIVYILFKRHILPIAHLLLIQVAGVSAQMTLIDSRHALRLPKFRLNKRRSHGAVLTVTEIAAGFLQLHVKKYLTIAECNGVWMFRFLH